MAPRRRRGDPNPHHNIPDDLDFTCSSSRLSCWLLDVLIDVLLFLGADGIILTLLGGILLLLGISKLCWVGWLIDTADFSLLALLAY